MNEYEVLVEDINPCGGSQYGKKTFLEVEAESPEAYVRQNAKWPILDTARNADGDVIITTGDGSGNIIRYTFSE